MRWTGEGGKRIIVRAGGALEPHVSHLLSKSIDVPARTLAIRRNLLIFDVPTHSSSLLVVESMALEGTEPGPKSQISFHARM